MSYTPFAISIAILLMMIYRIRNLSISTHTSLKPATQIEDYSTLMIELTNLRLRRDALRDMITKVYELANKGKIDDNIKRAILDQISMDLSKIEERIIYLEKYEELNTLIKEREKVEKEYKKKIEELDQKISSLRKIISPPPERKKEEKPKETKEKRVEKKPREERKDLSQVMEEIMRLLSEAEE